MKWDSLGSTVGLAVEIADFGHARFVPPAQHRRIKDKQVVDKGRNDMRRSMVGLTPGVCTYVYSGPELWCSGSTANMTKYGYSLDVWSYGTILFEMLTLERFVCGDNDAARVAAVVARLGPFPEGVYLGPRQESLMVAGTEASGTETSPPSLLTFGDPEPRSPWGHLAQTLCWDPLRRATAKALGVDPWFDGPSTIAGPSTIVGPNTMKLGVLAVHPSTMSTPTSTSANLTSSWKKRSWVEALSSDPQHAEPEPVVKRRHTCECKGHCWTRGHRYRNGCDSQQIVVNSKYCRMCECSMSGCHKPRHHGVWCHGHQKVFESLPFPLQAAHAAQGVLDDMMPCDMETFVELFPVFAGSLALCVCAVLLKEPTALGPWTSSLVALAASQGPPEASEVLFKSLQSLLEHVDGAPHQVELKQISRQGSPRFLGVSVWCQALGMISAVPEPGPNTQAHKPAQTAMAAPQGQVVKLGLLGKAFRVAAECPAQVKRFVEVCERLQPKYVAAMSASVDIIHLEKTLRPLFHEINMDCKCNWTKYVFDSLMRKIILGGIVSCNVTAGWPGTTLPELRRMVADEADYISAFPDT